VKDIEARIETLSTADRGPELAIKEITRKLGYGISTTEYLELIERREFLQKKLYKIEDDLIKLARDLERWEHKRIQAFKHTQEWIGMGLHVKDAMDKNIFYTTQFDKELTYLEDSMPKEMDQFIKEGSGWDYVFGNISERSSK
jgi:hypothetical protein